MAFDYVLLGKKLQEARESLLIDAVEAAERLQISVEDYLSVESGQKKATGDQVVLLASFYQRDFRYFVTGDYPSAESQIQEMFRLNASLSQNDRIAIQEFVRLCEYEDFLEREVFQKKSFSIPDYSQHRFGHNNFKWQGAESAALERTRLGLGQLAIIDIFELMRKQGIHVFKRQLEDGNISALYINHPTAGHCILVNYIDDLYRQNFSAAHEYCHALFDSVRKQEVTYLKSNLSEDEDIKKIEARANSFSRNFLVPKECLEKNYTPRTDYEDWIDTIRQIAKRFRVNYQVVIIRLQELGWITENLKKQLWNEKRLVIKFNEKFDPEIPPDLSPGQKERLTQIIRQGLSWHFIDLSTEAYRRGEITYHKLLEMLLLPLDQGCQLLNDFRTFLQVTEL